MCNERQGSRTQVLVRAAAWVWVTTPVAGPDKKETDSPLIYSGALCWVRGLCRHAGLPSD